MKYLTQNKTLLVNLGHVVMFVAVVFCLVLSLVITTSAAPLSLSASNVAREHGAIAIPMYIIAVDTPSADSNASSTGDVDGCTIVGGGDCSDPALSCDTKSGGECNLYEKYINPFIGFLSAFVGIAVTIGLIWGGIRYIMAGSDSSAVAQARKAIRNSLFALIIYILLWALINWVQPGGLG